MSRLQTFKEEIALALEGITVANGYNTTITGVWVNHIKPNAKTEWPVAAVLVPQDEIQCEDTNRSVWREALTAAILVYCKPSQLDGVVQDVKKCILGLAISKINEASPWMIKGEPDETVFTVKNSVAAEDLLWATFEFKVELLNVSGSF